MPSSPKGAKPAGIAAHLPRRLGKPTSARRPWIPQIVDARVGTRDCGRRHHGWTRNYSRPEARCRTSPASRDLVEFETVALTTGP
jgi:hypothetical protein